MFSKNHYFKSKPNFPAMKASIKVGHAVPARRALPDMTPIICAHLLVAPTRLAILSRRSFSEGGSSKGRRRKPCAGGLVAPKLVEGGRNLWSIQLTSVSSVTLWLETNFFNEQ
jgi:hypothetical protein